VGDLSRNFSRSEFACNCGEQNKLASQGYCAGKRDVVDTELLRVLQQLVDDYEHDSMHRVRVQITSGNRCDKHNADEGGAKESQHLLGKAADFKVFYVGCDQIPADDVYTYLNQKYSDRYGVGRYRNRTHLDVRRAVSRWDKTGE
jgi:uncharacterized protein YcbK (DUF882 family)